ncbi:unnamed protein product [Zymoseptoria tritici ST99CH_1A5]|uniref:AAA+ ATPase domain-containing protein n=1 Tax=Zymoseptoria tritici ST99CH_1A5 TaxID=1276529 RepID=A0A1Y6LQL9_ZYMTR|nr:unnamed protein product [Zymoseptoria tritici ST99CH_1A5]
MKVSSQHYHLLDSPSHPLFTSIDLHFRALNSTSPSYKSQLVDMDKATLLKPTLHIEVQLKAESDANAAVQATEAVLACLRSNYSALFVGSIITDSPHIERATAADYTGPTVPGGICRVHETGLDVQTYSLKTTGQKSTSRRKSNHNDAEDGQTAVNQARILPLPNTELVGEWDSLIYEDALPSKLLRCLVRMLGVMKQPGLNLSTFNWNRLCLLHGPPGSGKSTLCRALAQKLSIRLSKTFSSALLVEVNTNAMLSKYFGESGKLISQLFDSVVEMARPSSTLVVVVIDEIETIAGSRQKSTDGDECSDGLRATNQLLTALDKLRLSPNILVLCTSNLIGAIDPAFLDRVDIKQLIPSPSPEAIYNIFRSCLNELVRASLIDMAATDSAPRSAVVSATPSTVTSHSDPSVEESAPKRRAVTRSKAKQPAQTAPINQAPETPRASSPQPSSPWTILEPVTVPTFEDMTFLDADSPDSPGRLVWALAQKCEGFSGRTLRRLPILGLAMHTWGGDCSLIDAIAALAAAIEQELKTK